MYSIEDLPSGPLPEGFQPTDLGAIHRLFGVNESAPEPVALPQLETKIAQELQAEAAAVLAEAAATKKRARASDDEPQQRKKNTSKCQFTESEEYYLY
jgi:hypothetical protein